ncbi:penicillin-binding protein 1C [Prosthecomicrobium sp. N25]|uniref:penicillin-binding protein 1C n=1 Tax=Prosthecomicrobium sp. N25 TaxID=3129254 RepID=UPI003076B0A1
MTLDAIPAAETRPGPVGRADRPPAAVRPSALRRLLPAVLGLALVAIPLAAGLARGAIDYMASLGPLDLAPAELRSTIVVDRDGNLLRPFTTEDGRWRLPLEPADVDPAYLAMLFAYEDERFREHGGVDLRAMARAAGQLVLHRRVVSGASTITMQVARLIEPREERTLAAKLRQVARALELEHRFTKDEILALYLRLAPQGGNIEGVRAASFAYFGKEPRRLTHAEAALLVALPQSPEVRRPDRRPDLARRARDRVLDRARGKGLLTDREVAEAKAEPVPTGRLPFPVVAPHLSEELVAERPSEKIHRTTLDGRLQRRLEALAQARLRVLGPKVSMAILVVDNATGEVAAHVGGADYFDAERAGAVDLARAFRSPGSALKPFIYALAFENGIAHPETILEDRPARYGAWAPENFDQSFHGTVTARRALQNSLNVPAVELLDAVGPARLVARLKAAGSAIEMPKDAPPGLAIGLGGLGVRLVDLARLYGAFARGGDTVPLVWRAGAARPHADATAFVDPVSAWYVADILKGTPPPMNASPGVLAFKTGTSYGYRDAWAVGFDRRWTVAVWAGRPDGAPVSGLVGRLVAAPILFDAFSRIGTPPEAIPPPRDVLTATTATLPPPLRHTRKDIPKTVAATSQAALSISYPPDGARIDLGLVRFGRESAGPLALKALGGAPPLVWLVNGVPVGTPDTRRTAFWQPDGAGFAQVSVIDAKGATATVRVRLE